MVTQHLVPLSSEVPAPSVLGPAKLLYTRLKVRDLERSLRFYTDVLGMRLLRRQDYTVGRFTLAFIGDETEDTAVFELAHDWGDNDYEKGTAFCHMALGVPDVAGACARLEAIGVPVVRPSGPMQGDATEITAFVLDPDGYRIELVQGTESTGPGESSPSLNRPAAGPARPGGRG